MAYDLNYVGSFQRGMRIPSESPIDEVWSRIARFGTPEFASTGFAPTKVGNKWGKHANYASVRIRQACELRIAGRNSSLLTRPLTLYYSFLNLLRGVMALVPEVLSPSQHGLTYKSNAQLLLCEAKLTTGTFGTYLDCVKWPWKDGSTVSLNYCLSRIPEVLHEYQSPDRGTPNVIPVGVSAKIGSGEARLGFDKRFVEESQFRTNWATDYPQLKDLCELEENGCVLKVKQSFKESKYEGLCDFCEKNLWNSLVWSDDQIWYMCAFKVLMQQLVKGMGRTVPVQNLPRPIVEHRLHALDLAPRDAIEPGPCGKELAEQPVRVFVRAALPRTLRMSKVHLHLGLLGKETMLAHFLSLVVGEGAAELGGQRPHFTGEGPPHGSRILCRQRHQQRKPRGAFHQRPQCRRVGMAHEQVALPMARHRALGDLGWPFVDANNVLDGARREPDLAGTTKAVAPPQIAGEFSLEGPAGQHIQIGVDGFVRDAHRRVIRIPLE